MSTQKKLPSRRDQREAEGYLIDLFDVDGPNVSTAATPKGIADHLLGAAVEIKVQRATDRLVLYFDLNDEGDGALPEATTDADGTYNGGERVDDRHPLDGRVSVEAGGLTEFQPDGSDSA